MLLPFSPAPSPLASANATGIAPAVVDASAAGALTPAAPEAAGDFAAILSLAAPAGDPAAPLAPVSVGPLAAPAASPLGQVSDAAVLSPSRSAGPAPESDSAAPSAASSPTPSLENPRLPRPQRAARNIASPAAAAEPPSEPSPAQAEASPASGFAPARRSAVSSDSEKKHTPSSEPSRVADVLEPAPVLDARCLPAPCAAPVPEQIAPAPAFFGIAADSAIEPRSEPAEGDDLAQTEVIAPDLAETFAPSAPAHAAESPSRVAPEVAPRAAAPIGHEPRSPRLNAAAAPDDRPAAPSSAAPVAAPAARFDEATIRYAGNFAPVAPSLAAPAPVAPTNTLLAPSSASASEPARVAAAAGSSAARVQVGAPTIVVSAAPQPAAVFAPKVATPSAPEPEVNKNKSQVTYPQYEAGKKNVAGTEKAIDAVAMLSPSAQASSAAALPRVVESVEPAISQPAPAAAVRLVERVAEVAERLEARPAEQVRVSLDLAGDHRVEVKVAMRGGRVFADFRTDSPEMSAALSRAWGEFVRSREGAAQRWAEPVFAAASSLSVPPAAAPAPVSAAEARPQADSSARQDAASDHHAPRRESMPWTEVAPARVAGGRAASGSAAAPVAAPAPRTDSSRHLSAFA